MNKIKEQQIDDFLSQFKQKGNFGRTLLGGKIRKLIDLIVNIKSEEDIYNQTIDIMKMTIMLYEGEN